MILLSMLRTKITADKTQHFAQQDAHFNLRGWRKRMAMMPIKEERLFRPRKNIRWEPNDWKEQ